MNRKNLRGARRQSPQRRQVPTVRHIKPRRHHRLLGSRNRPAKRPYFVDGYCKATSSFLLHCFCVKSLLSTAELRSDRRRTSSFFRGVLHLMTASTAFVINRLPIVSFYCGGNTFHHRGTKLCGVVGGLTSPSKRTMISLSERMMTASAPVCARRCVESLLSAAVRSILCVSQTVPFAKSG